MTEQVDEFRTLLQQAKQGNEEALARLTQRYESQVRVVARVLLGPSLRPYLDSVDLVQSVHRAFLVGLRKDQFDLSSPEKLVGLALKLVRRKVAQQWRRLRRQRRLEQGTAGQCDLASLYASLASTELDPARVALAKDQLDHLMQDLDAEERRILEMRADGYRMAEIAEALQMQPGALRMRLMRLRQRLQGSGLFIDWF